MGNYEGDRWLDEKLSTIFLSISASSASLSIIGSTLILFMINRCPSSYSLKNRLLVMLSVTDIINSVASGLFSIPSPTEDLWGRPTFGFGNESTCNAQGFAIQVGTAVQGYNAMLCVYFMNVIKYGKCDSDIAEQYERFMHAYALLPPLITAILGSAADLYGSIGRYCWFQPNATFSVLAMVLTVTTVVLTILHGLIITVSMAKTYHAVLKTESRMDPYRYPNPNTRSKGKICSICCSSEGSERDRALRETFRQAMLYVLGYLITVTWSGVNLMIFMFSIPLKQTYETSVSLETLQTIFYPMQGLFNFLAFCWPRYIQMKRNNPELTFFTNLKKVIFDKTQSNTPARRLSLPPVLAEEGRSGYTMRRRRSLPDFQAVGAASYNHSNSRGQRRTSHRRSKRRRSLST